MAKKLTCLLLVLVMTCALAATAFAVDTLNLLSVRVIDQGYLRVLAGTDYTDPADLNFGAATEAGPLEISDSYVLRNEGTTWFFVLEIGNYDTQQYQKIYEEALKQFANLITDKDDGALVRCDVEHAVNVVKPNILREELVKKHDRTDAKELGNTISAVMQFIDQNQSTMMPNIAVVVLTAAPANKISDTMINGIESTLSDHRSVTTHVIVTAGESVNKKDREVGQKLVDKAKITVGGTGYMTDSLAVDEAGKGVQRIADAERRKILMFLDPKKLENIGHKLTITQKTSGGKEMSVELDLIDSLFTQWQEKFKERNPRPTPTVDPNTGVQPEPAPDDTEVVFDPLAGRTSTYVADEEMIGTNMGVQEEKSDSNLLIIIIAAAAVLAAAIAFLIVMLNKNKKKTAKGGSNTVYGPASAKSSSAASSGGTTITLTGTNGAVLKGQMKGGRLTFGRNGARAMLAVPNDGKLSSLHITFTKQGNQMTLIDNGSTNGTKVNGTKVAAGAPVTLNQNDTITAGSTTYTITWRG